MIMEMRTAILLVIGVILFIIALFFYILVSMQL